MWGATESGPVRVGPCRVGPGLNIPTKALADLGPILLGHRRFRTRVRFCRGFTWPSKTPPKFHKKTPRERDREKKKTKMEREKEHNPNHATPQDLDFHPYANLNHTQHTPTHTNLQHTTHTNTPHTATNHTHQHTEIGRSRSRSEGPPEAGLGSSLGLVFGVFGVHGKSFWGQKQKKNKKKMKS